MDIPQPPLDEETRNIIDRLANFVARNGQDFENMTKQKQRDNPKFQFLFGGENFAYYNYRVTTEQAILKQQAMRQQQQQQFHMPPNQMNQMQPQQQSLMGHSPFGSPSGPPRPSRFGPPLQQQQRFDMQQQAIRNNGPLMGQRFDSEPRYQNQNFGHHMNFERPQGPAGNFQNFDRGPPGDRFQSPAQMQQFDRNPGFERYPGPGSRFDNDMPQRPRFNQGIGHQMNPQLHGGMRPGFEGSPPRPFDRPHQDFERPILPAGLDRNSSSGFPNQHQQPLPQQVLTPPTPQIPAQVPPPAPLVNIEALTAQKMGLEEQISQSEKNLAGQQQVLLSKQQAEVEGTLRRLQDTKISELATELQVSIEEFGGLVQQVMTSCSKDAIVNARSWIWAHSSTEKHNDLISSYLLRRVTDPGTTFHQRLYTIYLVNDTLHHCPRRRLDELQRSLERVLIPMYCFTRCSEGDKDEENLAKLNKLLTIWKGNQNHVSAGAVEKLTNYTQSWSDYKNELVSSHAVIVTHIASTIQKTFEGYQNQHNLFVQHVTQAIKQLDQKIEEAIAYEQKQKVQEEEMRLQQEKVRAQQELQFRQEEEIRQQLRAAQQSLMNPQLQGPGPPGMMPQGHSLPYAPAAPNSQELDLSRPPPGFNDQQQAPAPAPIPEIPRLPYFELPAGLMVPLVKLEDDNYKPIDPSLIRLPAPCPPSERLIQALEAFYGPPSHDNPRDSEGWERLGLYEFYKSKNLARKQKEEDVREGRRQKSKSPSPVRREQSPNGRSPPRRRYQSKSPSPPTSKRRRSRSRSPRRNRRRRSRSRTPPRRSVTPPSFGATAGLGMERVLDESNKGHQLLKKMGWGGSGLGANEQGIEAPVKGGELRDRVDQYKGVGVNLNDPFESYRKSKGQAFVERMRARGDDTR